MLKLKTKFGEIIFIKPNNFAYADATTNIAFKLAKELKKSPKTIADEIVNEIKNNDIFENVVNVNGFINVFFSKKFLIDFIFNIISDKFISEIENKKFLFEFVSANPTGPLNIVNARAGAIGDSLVRIGKFLGNKVYSEYYVNDEGSQILNLGYSILWRMGVKFIYNKNTVEIKFENLNEPEILEINGEVLNLSSDIYRGDYVKEIAIKLNSKIKELLKNFKKSFNNQDEFLNYFNNFAYEIGKLAVDLILKEQLEILKEFKVNYDSIIRESFIRNSEYPKIILKMLKEYLYFEDKQGNKYNFNVDDIDRILDKNYYVEKYKDKALVLKTTIYGDDKDRVIIRSNGEPTYFFWDIAYHYYKISRIGKDGYIINLLGPDHYGYIPRLKSALKMLGFDNIEVLIVQQTNLIKDGKKLDMSKRKGQIYEMKELINEVGVSASRFFFLLRSPSSHLDFDIDLAKKLSSENPVYYVQYAHARIESIKENAINVGINYEFDKKYLMNYEMKNERNMIIQALYFEETIKKAFNNLEPHLLVYYLLELSEIFHSYYQKHRVIDIENKEQTIARIIILEAIRKIINKGLELIGVSAPKKM